jgi:hypothetical protein
LIRNRNIWVLMLIVLFHFFLFGCNSTSIQENEHESGLPGVIDETASEVYTEIVVRADKEDRLPGSLRWEHVALYAAGTDFLEHGGLKDEDPSVTDQPEPPKAVKQPVQPAPVKPAVEPTVQPKKTLPSRETEKRERYDMDMPGPF